MIDKACIQYFCHSGVMLWDSEFFYSSWWNQPVKPITESGRDTSKMSQVPIVADAFKTWHIQSLDNVPSFPTITRPIEPKNFGVLTGVVKFFPNFSLEN